VAQRLRRQLHYRRVIQLSQTLSIAGHYISLALYVSVRVCGPGVRKCEYQQAVQARRARATVSDRGFTGRTDTFRVETIVFRLDKVAELRHRYFCMNINCLQF